jgi:hypothetical protein
MDHGNKSCTTGLFLSYLLRPEPGPVGVNVDPLGDALGASELPDGFLVLFGAVFGAAVLPVVVVEGLVAGLEPTVGAAVCANANVLESANAAVSAMVVSLMAVPCG